MTTIRQRLSPPRANRALSANVLVLFLAALAFSVVRPAPAAAITIDFENLPSLPTQPNNFAAAGPIQTYTDAGVFSISGGVVLGNPTFLASFSTHGSELSPNFGDGLKDQAAA